MKLPEPVETAVTGARAQRVATSAKTPAQIERAAYRPYGAGPEGGVQTVAYPGRRPIEVPIDPRYAETLLGPPQPGPLPTRRGALELPAPEGAVLPRVAHPPLPSLKSVMARAGKTGTAPSEPFIRIVETLQQQATPTAVAGVQKELTKASPAVAGQLKAWLRNHLPAEGWEEALALFARPTP